MDVARLNFSHGSYAGHKAVIASVRETSARLERPVAILQDLAGPKIRLGRIESGSISLKSGDSIVFTSRRVPGDEKAISTNYPRLAQDVKPGDILLLSDGALELEVLETTAKDVKSRVVVGGTLSSGKGINFPTRSLQVPSLTKKDKTDLSFGLTQNVDYVALSFVRSAEDIIETRRFMQKKGRIVPIIAKIEKHEALDTIDGIVAEADGIMVARGDLGVETPFEKVPLVQKSLIHKANRAGIPVITATQMLRSMVENPRPTRAEAADVANAILDGTDAVMLSEETAVGKYPVEAVSVMVRIAQDVEAHQTGRVPISWLDIESEMKTPEAVSYAAANLAKSLGASAIITFTQSGSTARLVAKYRPPQKILAPTPREDTYRRLALVHGVIPLLCTPMEDTDAMIQGVFQLVQKSGLVKTGDKVVVTAGIPMGVEGSTNLIKAEIL